MGVRLQVNVTNNSSQSTTIILFQKVPDQDWFQGLSLAWKSQRLSPGSRVAFDWARDYCFVAGNTGQLMPGMEFNIDTRMEADPNGQNAATLDFDRGNCQFTVGQSRQSGKLYLSTGNSGSQQSQISAGIGMSDEATVITQARPGMSYQFSADVEYWVAFGNYESGQVLPQNVPNAACISFPAGKNVMNVVLGQDGQFTITPA